MVRQPSEPTVRRSLTPAEIEAKLATIDPVEWDRFVRATFRLALDLWELDQAKLASQEDLSA